MIACFEYFQSCEDGLWYFQLKAPNDGILVQSGSYQTKDECLYGIDMVRMFSDAAALTHVKQMSITVI
jgi:uncharacterized protein YegP (UPF0339 family)